MFVWKATLVRLQPIIFVAPNGLALEKSIAHRALATNPRPEYQ